MKYILTLMLSIAVSVSVAQDKKNVERLTIQTSSVCDMCERTIEEEMIYEKGVKSVDLDLATNVVTVEYDPRKNTPDGLRSALVGLGYSADGMPGDPAAFAKLPACCQKEGCGQPKKD